jgi:Fic family protein
MLDDILLAFAEATGHISGLLRGLPNDVQTDAIITMMIAEAVKTSEIEGEYFSREDVASSIRNKLGLISNQSISNKNAEGVGALMVIVRNAYNEPLTNDMLFVWHKTLLQQHTTISLGKWRSDTATMQVICGAIGKEVIHFEAPPSANVPNEMQKFINWYNDTAPGGINEIKKAPIRSALAHLYFESIHPFEDGNGRIGRAIAEKALSQTLGRPVLLSLSKTIEANKKLYYDALKLAQQSDDVTEWLFYFTNVVLEAQLQSIQLVEVVLRKTNLFSMFSNQLNQRQLKALNKMFDAEPEGFVGGMTAKKYISITKASKATATRDLQTLETLGILQIAGGGRSTHYYLDQKIW